MLAYILLSLLAAPLDSLEDSAAAHRILSTLAARPLRVSVVVDHGAVWTADVNGLHCSGPIREDQHILAECEDTETYWHETVSGDVGPIPGSRELDDAITYALENKFLPNPLHPASR